MPRKKDDDWQSDGRGRYRRKVGVWFSPSDMKLKPYKFSFGTNKDKAKARLARVREVWAHVVEREKKPPVIDGIPSAFELDYQDREPRWGVDDLFVAKELARGNVQIVVTKFDTETPEAYAHKIARLAAAYPFVVFVPEDTDVFGEGTAFIDRSAEHQIQKITRLSPNILPQVTEALHTAFDEYIEFIKRDSTEPTEDGPTLSPFGSHRIANVIELKARHSDRPISTLEDFDACQELIDHWRNRPLTRDKRIKPPRPMAKKTCQNKIAELMRFFRWLHRSKRSGWRKPQDFDELRTDVKDKQSERTSIAAVTERNFYLSDELAIINKHATPLERLLLLLGLNCGFRGAEQGTLLLDHLYLDRPHPNADYLKVASQYKCAPDDRFILYTRNKTGVYGEFLLWPQTVEVLRWATERQQRIVTHRGLPYRNLLVTEKGTLFYRLTGGQRNRSQIFMNKWSALIKRVQKSQGDFPAYPFKTLRITAADLIRQRSDGEVAATFLLHGEPVKTDNLLDLYTKRPFAKLFKALKQLQEELKSVFDAAPEDVTEQPMQQYTPLDKREQIVALKRQGRKVSEIMAEVGVSKMTVMRTLDRLYYKKRGLAKK